MQKRLLILAVAVLSTSVWAQGNTHNDSFNKAKRMLEQQVYYDHRVTFYCEASFDAKKKVTLPAGFVTEKFKDRAERLEWEHVVPAENFGRTFLEWREGHPDCVNKGGKAFKGRKCAEKVNNEYRFMQSDMYNLYPAIGAVNAARQNYRFQELPGVQSDFGSCAMKIDNRRVEPPENARGPIARTYLYMQEAYPRFRLSRSQQNLMQAWNKQYPVDQWECTRAKRIEAIQGNENRFVKEPCLQAKLW